MVLTASLKQVMDENALSRLLKATKQRFEEDYGSSIN